LARNARLPTLYAVREYVEAGGLMSYGPNWPSMWRRAADLVDKVLRGANPAELPVEQPAEFDLVINLITAKALGLPIPDKLLALANAVIELDHASSTRLDSATNYDIDALWVIPSAALSALGGSKAGM
jgi:putative ABC transport system substrate-binding protein